MKKCTVAALLLLTLTVLGQNHDKACGTLLKINKLLQDDHLKPKPIDDSLSAYVFRAVTEGLDDNHTLLLQDDYDRLAMHRLQLDDYLKRGDCSFFSDFISVYRSALERTRRFTEEVKGEAFAASLADTIYFSKNTFPYNKEEARIKRYVRKRIMYDILEDVAKQGKNKDSLMQHLEALAKPARERAIETALCRVNALLNPAGGFEDSMYNRFFTAFCNYFDPHTTYFNYTEKSSFVSNISSQTYSLGLYVSQNEKDEIVVEELVPGGPALLSKKIDKGDQLLKLTANGQEYTVSCASLETISDIVFSDTYKKVNLTMRKKDGTVYDVAIEKTIMKAEDHSVYSYVLGSGEKAVGYLRVPSFYTGYENDNHGCADDVATELRKLKKENINGLILDLQYNGGGSMDEVIRMAGMFIDFGPLSVVTDRNRTRDVINDYNRGMLYKGPMVVLVNGLSASASEFFAGVMQDYNRAVIAGTRTMGKASMQTIRQLEGSEQDFVKVTIDKFYRVTGKSGQYIGISPDVEMPSLMERFVPRESAQATALKNDSITGQPFNPWPKARILSVAELSRGRIKSNAAFEKIKSINSRIDKMYDDDKAPLPLTFDKVFDDVHALDGVWKDINAQSESDSGVAVRPTDADAKAIGADAFRKSINDYKMKSIKSDPFVPEGVNILNDLISGKQK